MFFISLIKSIVCGSFQVTQTASSCVQVAIQRKRSKRMKKWKAISKSRAEKETFFCNKLLQLIEFNFHTINGVRVATNGTPKWLKLFLCRPTKRQKHKKSNKKVYKRKRFELNEAMFLRVFVSFLHNILSFGVRDVHVLVRISWLLTVSCWRS